MTIKAVSVKVMMEASKPLTVDFDLGFDLQLPFLLRFLMAMAAWMVALFAVLSK